MLQKKIILVSSTAPDKCSNAVLLACCAMVLNYGKTPAKALEPLKGKEDYLPLTTFRDAGYGPATYWIDVPDCVHALHKGIQAGFFDVKAFDIEQYDYYEKVENGDFNWVLPRFFLALATPNDHPQPHILRYHEEVKAGRIQPPQSLSKRFQPMIEVEKLIQFLRTPAMAIKAMVRLNNKLYDRQKFIDGGIEHYELYFPDGSVPPFDSIVKKFLLIADTTLPIHLLLPNEFPVPEPGTRGAMGIHCKAGLGRTGTLICCWIMKTFRWTAREAISWCRIMRPGSVVGPQQNWLANMEEQLWAVGDDTRREREMRRVIGHPLLSVSPKNEGNHIIPCKGCHEYLSLNILLSIC